MTEHPSNSYEDEFVRCDDRGITLKFYYFPVGIPKFIPWATVKKAEEKPLRLWSGKYRIWGMGLRPVWFSYDPSRPFKKTYIELDIGSRIRAAFSPVNGDRVLSLIRERLASDAGARV